LLHDSYRFFLLLPVSCYIRLKIAATHLLFNSVTRVNAFPILVRCKCHGHMLACNAGKKRILAPLGKEFEDAKKMALLDGPASGLIRKILKVAS